MLATQPQLTLDTLAEFSGEDRKRLVNWVYTGPVHDGFDFLGIGAALHRAAVPAGLAGEVAMMRERVDGLARWIMRPAARDRVRLAEAAVARGSAGYEEAVREYELAAIQASKWTLIPVRLGRLHLEHGNGAAALAAFRAYLGLARPKYDPDEPEVERFVATLQRTHGAQMREPVTWPPGATGDAHRHR